ncbi:glutamine amidotransferase [Magnetospirillum molischianum]|uniref:GMP synthase-Glutamine amidotransferase domain n=1 Tax=Magnetospirillum molischianum DSM 120 TaxID=1150626 RepID=H8FRP3_MAGML|nr:glutamine amidotransferase [Magnetospirillum molischianum]CCG41031.1 GMP synthase-Glutamine amidotransferase domain [Magnetospirillum molischianum DSM 120]
MRTCVALRHVAFEDLGSFEPYLRAAGYEIVYHEAGYDDLAALDPLAPDLLVVLGGPIGAYDDELYPFLRDELRLVEARLAAGRPLIGLCLGAQLMARSLGARVRPNPAGREIGWSQLSLTAAGIESPLGELAGVDVLHWHGDIFDLPAGSQALASTSITPNQAFLHGSAALGLQFHVEATARGMERWFIGHAAEIGVAGLSVPELRAATARNAALLERQGTRLLARFLDGIGLLA